MDTDAIVRRWKANTAAVGIRLTDEDVARIVERGFVARIARVEQIIEEAGADHVVPDYLQVLSARAGDTTSG
jgi:hypothetical protein